jgi:hypothetical protein
MRWFKDGNHTICIYIYICLARRLSASQEIPRILRNPKSPLPVPILSIYKYYYFYYRYSFLGPVRAETRAQSGDWYGSGTLHPGQILRGSLPLLSPYINNELYFSVKFVLIILDYSVYIYIYTSIHPTYISLKHSVYIYTYIYDIFRNYR